jgi:ATP/ADP translocase
LSPFERLAEWLNIRPHEVRTVVLSFCGAFLVLSFLVLGRALREALYLTTFPVETLPYITAAVALFSLPVVALFARLLAGRDPRTVLKALLVVLAVGIAALWPIVSTVQAAVVVFYLWLALGTLLLTSGFWLVTAELFAVRGAKRLFGLIGAGGTLGAMVSGNLLAALSDRLVVSEIIPGLILILALFLAIEYLLPPPVISEARRAEGGMASAREGLGLVWKTRHLRTVALVVFTATVASTLVDYQFKDLAQGTLSSRESLAGFFGAFYGWTGAVALVLQVFVASRVMASAGIGVTLSVLPIMLLLGSAGLLILPSLALATIVRGADNSLRKSLHRSGLEVLYVPIPAALRRKTKTFIDSVVDALGEGVGAGIVFLWVTLPGFPSHFLSVFVIGLAGLFLYLSRFTGRTYVSTVTDQLRRGGEAIEARTDQRDLLSASFTRLDLRPVLEQSGVATPTIELESGGARASALLSMAAPLEAEAEIEALSQDASADTPVAETTDSESSSPPGEDRPDPMDLLHAPREADVRRGLELLRLPTREHVPALVRLLARERLVTDVTVRLVGMEELALPHLSELVRDADTDFTIRRRIPPILAKYESPAADDALLDALTAPRFEVRYRCAIGLMERRRRGRALSHRDWPELVWDAVRREVGRERPVWELQRLLDDVGPTEDGLVAREMGARGSLSLEHTFRLLSLVLDPEAVRAAFRGVAADDLSLNSLALEYLEHCLPEDVRVRLWPFIGDLSARQQAKASRPLQDVVSDLVTTNATLFGGELQREDLHDLLRRDEEPPRDDED